MSPRNRLSRGSRRKRRRPNTRSAKSAHSLGAPRSRSRSSTTTSARLLSRAASRRASTCRSSRSMVSVSKPEQKITARMRSPTSRANRRARAVFPTPAGPTITIGSRISRPAQIRSSSSSCSRPTNAGSTGKLGSSGTTVCWGSLDVLTGRGQPEMRHAEPPRISDCVIKSDSKGLLHGR